MWNVLAKADANLQQTTTSTEQVEKEYMIAHATGLQMKWERGIHCVGDSVLDCDLEVATMSPIARLGPKRLL